jgi:hypothetical protein
MKTVKNPKDRSSRLALFPERPWFLQKHSEDNRADALMVRRFLAPVKNSSTKTNCRSPT